MRHLSESASKWLKSKTNIFSSGLGAGLFLLLVFLGAKWLPQQPIDPWGLFVPSKIAWVLFALSVLQIVSVVLARFFGAKLGMALSGFFGGLMSSTATTLSLARSSVSGSETSTTLLLVSLLGSVVAMLVEAVLLVFAGGSEIFQYVHWIIVIPASVALILVGVLFSRHRAHVVIERQKSIIDYQAVVNLTAVIVLILAMSKFLQQIFGESGVRVLTFFVSLFEVHGSLIASSQRIALGEIADGEFRLLVLLSLLASMISKIGIVIFFGSRRMAIKSTLALILLMASAGVGYLVGG